MQNFLYKTLSGKKSPKGILVNLPRLILKISRFSPTKYFQHKKNQDISGNNSYFAKIDT